MTIGFKEWQAVCDALASGEQSLILRKGGIADASGRFRFEHDAFFLFPTLHHEQAVKLRPEFAARVELPPRDAERSEVSVELFAQIDFQCHIDDHEVVSSLSPFHVWNEAEIAKRFESGEAPGITLAVVRVLKLAAPWVFPNRKAYGGCRSWVELPEREKPPSMAPVLEDGEYGRVYEQLVAAAGLRLE